MQTLKKFPKQNGLSSFLSAEKKKQVIFRKSLGKDFRRLVALMSQA
jgi:hypothetical protein